MGGWVPGRAPERGYHPNPRNQQKPPYPNTYVGASLVGARWEGCAATTQPRYPRLRSGAHSALRRAGLRSGTRSCHPATLSLSSRAKPRDLRRSPTTTTLFMATRAYLNLVSPDSDRGPTPPFVLPDSDPVPTVGRGTGAATTQPRLPRLRSGAHTALRLAGLRSGTHGGARGARGYHPDPRIQRTLTHSKTPRSGGFQTRLGDAGPGYTTTPITPATDTRPFPRTLLSHPTCHPQHVIPQPFHCHPERSRGT